MHFRSFNVACGNITLTDRSKRAFWRHEILCWCSVLHVLITSELFRALSPMRSLMEAMVWLEHSSCLEEYLAVDFIDMTVFPRLCVTCQEKKFNSVFVDLRFETNWKWDLNDFHCLPLLCWSENAKIISEIDRWDSCSSSPIEKKWLISKCEQNIKNYKNTLWHKNDIDFWGFPSASARNFNSRGNFMINRSRENILHFGIEFNHQLKVND
jgi:hypothetical protein